MNTKKNISKIIINNSNLINIENSISFDELNYTDLIFALNNRKCTENQAKMLYDFLKSNKNNLEKFNIDKNVLKCAINKQLGNLKNSRLRLILVDIEFLFGW